MNRNTPTTTTSNIPINELARAIHDNAVEKGFWAEPQPLGVKLMLAVSELAEALEADRDGAGLIYHEPDGKPEGVAVEIADCVIRCLDTLVHLGVDVEEVITEKMAYNSNRPPMHGKAY